MSYRYIGNKTRHLKFLMSQVRSHVAPGAVVADLMCGTASVSAALRAEGYRVVAADLMTFAAQHAAVRLLLDAPPPFRKLGRGYFEVLDHLQNLRPRSGLMVREYSPGGTPLAGCAPRKYLTESNAARIDAITRQINEWDAKGLLAANERSLLRHDLVLATNRVANIAGTYGHYRSSWTNGSLSTLTLLPTEFTWGCSTNHRVIQGPAEVTSQGLKADLCYLDPPYMKRQYAANYHLIETIARGDEPDAIGLSGLRPWRDQYSDFCSKLKIRAAFGAIFRGMDCPRFLISYSEDGLLSRTDMTEMLGLYGEVDVEEFIVPRFRSNQSPLDKTMTEYLFSVRRPSRSDPRRRKPLRQRRSQAVHV